MKMRGFLKIFILLFLFTTACGGGGGGGENNNIPDVVLYEAIEVEYTLDENQCLIDDNSESTIFYDNGQNMSKTLMWNCASYLSFTNEQYDENYIELIFLSRDGGQCYQLASYFTTESICGVEAVQVNNPTYAAQINDIKGSFTFNVGTWYDFDYSLIVQNDSDINLLNTYDKMTISGKFYDGVGNMLAETNKIIIEKSTMDHLPVFTTVTTSNNSIVITDLQSGEYQIEYQLFMWDGTLLDVFEKTFSVP